MSKINAIRIINLNYNNNTIKIDDETFDFASESTLMSLRNGGGKTVLVQMMMAPFVSKRYRDLKDRKFLTYFGSNPTYLLTEWQLDDNGGYLLVGMVIRKKAASSDDDSSDELDIFTFIHHYDQTSKYDIYNIPIVEIKKDGRKSIKGYHNFKTELEEARKTLKYPLDVFNMNVYEQSKKYFQKLKEYKIDNKEWNIIHRINLKESGLSELFSDTKNVEGLVEKWFLTTVEDKLNKSGNKIKSFNEIVKKYIFQYREIQSKIEKKNTIELFCSELESLIDDASILNESEYKLNKQKNTIANFIKYLQDLSFVIEKEMRNIQNNIIELNNEIIDLKYQEISKEWHENDDEIDKLNNILNELIEEQDELLQSKSNEQQQLNIYECVELYEEYKANLQDLRELESKLENINKTEEEKSPRRNNLGFSLKLHYEEELKKLAEKLDDVKKNIENLNDNLNKTNELSKNLNNKHTGIIRRQTELETLISSFEKEEDRFEKKSRIILPKNLLGLYEDGFLEDTEKRIENDIQGLENKINALNKDNEEKNLLIDVKSNEINDLELEGEKKRNLLEKSLKQRLIYDDELNLRKNMVRILSLSNDDIYNKNLIIDKTLAKIHELRKKGDDLIIQKSNVENEKAKLERGIFTEVPVMLKEKLDELDIEFVYGMDWLNNNKKESSENDEIIKKNPFLPYSLILNEEDIIKIQKSNINEFVSSPIPIIKRSSIFNEIIFDNNLLRLNDITFYISFDNRLIDKNELLKIIAEKENELRKLNEKINLNEDDKKDYEEKLYQIKETTVELKLINDVSNNIESINKFLVETEDKIIKYASIIKQYKRIISDNNELYKESFDKLLKLRNIRDEFREFMTNYNKFMLNKEQLKIVEKEIKVINSQIADNNELLNKLRSNFNDEKERLNNVKNVISAYETERNKYSQYNEGHVIDRDFEVIKSDYDSVTKEITSDRKFAEDMKNNADKSFQKSQDKLLNKKKDYGLEETDFNYLSYDEYKHKELKNKFKYTDEILKKKVDEIHKYDIEKTKIIETNKNLIKTISEKFGFDSAKDKESILNINFNIKMKLKTHEKEQQEKLYKIKDNEFKIINKNIDKLDQYKDYVVSESIILNIPINQIDEFKSKIDKDINECENIVNNNKKSVQRSFENIYNNNRFKLESMCSSSLETIRSCMDISESFLEQLNIVLKSCQTLIEKLQVDIEFIYKDEEEVLTILFDYIKDVHDNLNMIDNNSSVNIEGRSIKMLKIKLPDWDVNKERYIDSLKFILEKLRDESLKKLSENEAIDEIISKTVSTNYMYNNVVGISNIEIKLYKIEENRQLEISWNNVSTNSGGEGFLSAFVILSSLLTYMRKDETDIFSNNKDSKVIVMDNPFAQTNASHLLKPLMSIAEKSNTQLICFSGLGGDSIYNRFNNIYVLDIVQSKLNPNKQYLKHNHEKGEEFVNKIQSARFKIEEKTIEQIQLF